MDFSTHTFFTLLSGTFASVLAHEGIQSLLKPQEAARSFGLAATTPEALAYMPVWGVRDLGFGVSILMLLVADSTGAIPSTRGKAAAIVTAIGACVGLADSQLVRVGGGQGAVPHAVGASAMAASALGLWVTA